jgi:hypothetical protein
MSAMKEARFNTIALMGMMDEGLIDPKQLAEQLMLWMSEADVEAFTHHYEYNTLEGAYEE